MQYYFRDDTDGTPVVMLRVTDEAKDALLADPASGAFDSPHYRGHGAVAIKLAVIDADRLAELLAASYRLVAPKKLIRELDASAPLAQSNE